MKRGEKRRKGVFVWYNITEGKRRGEEGNDEDEYEDEYEGVRALDRR